MIKTISVLGCGWLGEPLASRCVSKGLIVKGSTTSTEKLEFLQSKRIKPFLLNFNPVCSSDVGNFFQTDVLFLNIPFKRTLIDPHFYSEQIKAVRVLCHQFHTPWVIVASSTLVYPDGGHWVEDMPLLDLQGRAKILWQIEQDLLNDPHFKTTVIRFAGLYGPHREPVQFLKRASIKNPDGCVNLIHLDDCLGIIEAILNSGQTGIFNAVSDAHPTRRELYARLALTAGLEPPTFESFEGPPACKIVSNAKIKAVLQYRLQHPDIK